MNSKTKKNKSFAGIGSAPIVIVFCFIVAYLLFKYVFGDPSHFMNGDPANHPLPGDLLGTISQRGHHRTCNPDIASDSTGTQL